MKAVIVAIFLTLFASPIGALAQSAEPEWSYSVAFSVWASPASPGDTLDAYDPVVAASIDQLLFFVVVDFPREITPEEFSTSSRDLVEAAGFSDATPLSPSPGLLTDSVAFADTLEGVATDLIVAYEGDLMFVAMSLDLSGDANADATFDKVVRAYLTSYGESPAPPLMEALVSGFADDALFTTERPLAWLPARGDVPPDFQLLDEDLLLVDDPTFDIFGGGT